MDMRKNKQTRKGDKGFFKYSAGKEEELREIFSIRVNFPRA